MPLQFLVCRNDLWFSVKSSEVAIYSWIGIWKETAVGCGKCQKRALDGRTKATLRAPLLKSIGLITTILKKLWSSSVKNYFHFH